MTEDKMVRWHHQLNAHEIEQAPELVIDREAWHAVVCGVTESDMTATELNPTYINNFIINWLIFALDYQFHLFMDNICLVLCQIPNAWLVLGA